tara:strand:+ start:713 stop:949 length:237 start_codon:yes stop_codon:yes gene_type:complete
MITNFLRRLIKLDDYIDDRVFTEIDSLVRELEELRSSVDSNEIELNDRPSFYEMEVIAEDKVNDGIADVIDRIEALEE